MKLQKTIGMLFQFLHQQSLFCLRKKQAEDKNFIEHKFGETYIARLLAPIL